MKEKNILVETCIMYALSVAKDHERWMERDAREEERLEYIRNIRSYR